MRAFRVSRTADKWLPAFVTALLLAAPFLAFLLVLHRIPFRGDSFWHLAAGEQILRTGHAISRDPWSWSMRGAPWADQEWGFEVLMALAYNAARFYGLFILSAGMGFGMLLACLVWFQRQGLSAVTAGAVLAWEALAISPFFHYRPQDASYLLFAVYLLVLGIRSRQEFDARQDRRLFAVLAVLTVLWANLHGSFPLAVLLVGLAGVTDWIQGRLRPDRKGDLHSDQSSRQVARGRRAVLASIILAAAGLLNPKGIDLYGYVLHSLGNPAINQMIVEWQSPNFQDAYMLFAIILPVLVLATLGMYGKRVPSPFLVVLVTGALIATLRAVRFAPYLDLAAVFALGEALPGMSVGQVRFTRASGLLAVPLIGAGLAIFWPQHGGLVRNAPSSLPAKAVALLRRLPPGRVWNAYSWGGYLIWRGIAPAIDGRANLYSQDGFLQEYVRVINLAVPPQAVLRRDRVRYILMDPGSPLVTYLEGQPGWRVMHRSTRAVLLMLLKGR